MNFAERMMAKMGHTQGQGEAGGGICRLGEGRGDAAKRREQWGPRRTLGFSIIRSGRWPVLLLLRLRPLHARVGAGGDTPIAESKIKMATSFACSSMRALFDVSCVMLSPWRRNSSRVLCHNMTGHGMTLLPPLLLPLLLRLVSPLGPRSRNEQRRPPWIRPALSARAAPTLKCGRELLLPPLRGGVMCRSMTPSRNDRYVAFNPQAWVPRSRGLANRCSLCRRAAEWG